MSTNCSNALTLFCFKNSGKKSIKLVSLNGLYIFKLLVSVSSTLSKYHTPSSRKEAFNINNLFEIVKFSLTSVVSLIISALAFTILMLSPNISNS